MAWLSVGFGVCHTTVNLLCRCHLARHRMVSGLHALTGHWVAKDSHLENVAASAKPASRRRMNLGMACAGALVTASHLNPVACGPDAEKHLVPGHGRLLGWDER